MLNKIVITSLIYLTLFSAQANAAFESPFKNKSYDFFPVPILETRPDEGESYGLMPILLLSDKETQAISMILGIIGQYNSTVKWSGAALAYWYPDPNNNPSELFEFYFELGQRYFRENTIHYFNPKFYEKFYLDAKFVWLKTPFPRFYGIGADTAKSGESNYVSRNFLTQVTFGCNFLDKFRINLNEKFTTTDVLTRAFTVDDTLTRYGGLSSVYDSTNFIHGLSFTYDTRENAENSHDGIFAEAGYFFSSRALGSDTTFQGFHLEGIHMFSWLKDRMTTITRFYMQDMFGTNIPFYLQSQLGGDKELRSFIPNRFTDTGKAILTIEQRIRVLSLSILGTPVEFYTDPFVEVGRVFQHLNNFSLDDFQTVVGLGLRAFVPPNVVGRLDIAVGSEGYSIYTMLGYPF